MPRKSTAAAPVAEPTLADAFSQIAAIATASQDLATSVTELRSAVVTDSQRIASLERAAKVRVTSPAEVATVTSPAVKTAPAQTAKQSSHPLLEVQRKLADQIAGRATWAYKRPESKLARLSACVAACDTLDDAAAMYHGSSPIPGLAKSSPAPKRDKLAAKASAIVGDGSHKGERPMRAAMLDALVEFASKSSDRKLVKLAQAMYSDIATA